MPTRYTHKRPKRRSNPGMGQARHNGVKPGKFVYELTPHDEPELGWFGKAEGT